MLEASTSDRSADISPAARSEIRDLHARCGVYTKLQMVRQILDDIGWTADSDLSHCRLLEPAAGDGAFVIEAAKRLLCSLERTGRPPNIETLFDRILAFELLEDEASKGRVALFRLLTKYDIGPASAKLIAKQWLRTADFLLHELTPASFSHVAGNPPYTRWSRIPQGLRKAYEATLPSDVAKGDLFLPFLDRGIEALQHRGRLGFLCSNRWQFMAFAEGFRRERLPQVNVLRNEEVDASDVYERSVSIYPSVLILEKTSQKMAPSSIAITKERTLSESGFEVRVGPALGCTAAYVLDADDPDVEAELLAPWVSASEIQEGQIDSTGKRVICLYDRRGKLRNLQHFPLAHARLLRFKDRLGTRTVVRSQNAPWYRPIDRVYPEAWQAPKLLIPELAKTPRIAMDISGAIPSHGVYAIFARDVAADLEELQFRLAQGGLARLLEGKAPKVKGGYVRCYKRILQNITLPA